MAYDETSKDEKSVVYSHSNEIPKKFAVYVKERQDRLPKFERHTNRTIN